MSVFFRFLRPVVYAKRRNQIETHANGGICFQVVKSNNAYIDVSYSLCDFDTIFDAEVAKRIAKNRSPYRICCENLSTKNVARALIAHQSSLSITDNPIQLYQLEDLSKAVALIKKIQATHESARRLASIDRDAMSLLNVQKIYEARSR